MIDLGKILQQIEQELVRRLNTFNFWGFINLPEIEQQNILAQIDLFGYDELLNAIQQDNIETLNRLQKLANEKNIIIDIGNPERFEMLIKQNIFQARKASEYHLSQVFNQTIYGFLNGQSTNEILSRIHEDVPLAKNQLIAEIDQTVSKYNQTATAQMFDDPKQRFVLSDFPLDNRTRCECRAVISHQSKEGWTKAQIDGGAATRIVKQHCPKVKEESQKYTWLDRGGYNCRHNWEPV